MRKRLSFQALIERNKEEIIRDMKEMDKVEKRVQRRNNANRQK